MERLVKGLVCMPGGGMSPDSKIGERLKGHGEKTGFHSRKMEKEAPVRTFSFELNPLPLGKNHTTRIRT